MSLKEQITEDMKAAMRAKDSVRLGAIRLLQAAIKDFEVNTRTEADDTQITSIIEKMLKQRKDSIAAFEKAGRTDLAEKEQSEVLTLSVYMPAQMDATEISAAIGHIVADFVKENSRQPTAADMGKLMGEAKKQLAGKADMAQVSASIKAALA